MLFYTYKVVRRRADYSSRICDWHKEYPLTAIATPTWLGRWFGLEAKEADIYLKPWVCWKYESNDEDVSWGIEFAAIRYVDTIEPREDKPAPWRPVDKR